MAKEGSKSAVMGLECQEVAVNTDAPWPDLDEAEFRVLKIQARDAAMRGALNTFNLGSF